MTITEYYASIKARDVPIVFRAGLRAVPKGRPRFSGNHAYTPKSTREFEAQIRALGLKAIGERTPYNCPVRVTLLLVEEVPKSWPSAEREAALANLLVPLRGDLDNREKAVTDALNGIVYYDDVQIGAKVSSKEFGSVTMLTVTIERHGLSALEIDRYKKMIRDDNGNRASRGGTTMG